MDSMQPQLEFFNLHQVEIDNALCIQDSIAGIIEAQDTLTTSLGSYYDRQQLFQSLEPFYALQEQINASFGSIPHYYVENDIFSKLAENASETIKNIGFPIQQLHESLQHIADAAKSWDGILSTFFSNIENIHISCDLGSNGYIDLPEPFAKLVSDIDDSITLSPPNHSHTIRVDKSDLGTFLSVIAILISLISLIHGACTSNASSVLSKKQHEELMKEEQRQTELLEHISDSLDSMLIKNTLSIKITEK